MISIFFLSLYVLTACCWRFVFSDFILLIFLFLMCPRHFCTMYATESNELNCEENICILSNASMQCNEKKAFLDVLQRKWDIVLTCVCEQNMKKLHTIFFALILSFILSLSPSLWFYLYLCLCLQLGRLNNNNDKYKISHSLGNISTTAMNKHHAILCNEIGVCMYVVCVFFYLLLSFSFSLFLYLCVLFSRNPPLRVLLFRFRHC